LDAVAFGEVSKIIWEITDTRMEEMLRGAQNKSLDEENLNEE